MAGGTGGHIYPALAVANLLRQQQWQVSWMGTRKGMETRIAVEHNFAIDWLVVAGFRGKNLLAKVNSSLLFLRACCQAYKILHKRKPDVVLGMGGFVAAPGGLISKVMGMPLLIHEQNAIPGTTNRILAKFATKVLESFPASFAPKYNAIYTGNPLRDKIAKLVRQRRDYSSINLLVVGGSLGAKILNEVVPKAVSMVGNVAVFHQTGKAMFKQVEDDYAVLKVEAKVRVFIDDMADAYQWADMIVCRAGAMTISEIAAAGLPSILVPFPFATDDHQTVNANYLVNAGAGILIKQEQFNTQILCQKIKQLLENPKQLAAMSVAVRSCTKLYASESIAKICYQEANDE